MILALNIDFFKVTMCRLKCIILGTVAGVGQTPLPSFMYNVCSRLSVHSYSQL